MITKNCTTVCQYLEYCNIWKHFWWSITPWSEWETHL